jgi:hypothetical protein
LRFFRSFRWSSVCWQWMFVCNHAGCFSPFLQSGLGKEDYFFIIIFCMLFCFQPKPNKTQGLSFKKLKGSILQQSISNVTSHFLNNKFLNCFEIQLLETWAYFGTEHPRDSWFETLSSKELVIISRRQRRRPLPMGLNILT